MQRRRNRPPLSAGQNIRDSAEPTAASTGKNPGATPDKTLTTDEKLDLVRVLVDNVAEDFNEEDILHMMLEKGVRGSGAEPPCCQYIWAADRG